MILGDDNDDCEVLRILIFNRVKTGAVWGGTFALIGLYLTDWKVVLGYVPFIKDKFEREVPK